MELKQEDVFINIITMEYKILEMKKKKINSI